MEGSARDDCVRTQGTSFKPIKNTNQPTEISCERENLVRWEIFLLIMPYPNILLKLTLFWVNAVSFPDEKSLDHYGIKEGTKLILAIRKTEESGSDTNILRSAAYTFLRRFYTEPEARKIQEEFIKVGSIHCSSLILLFLDI